MAAAREQICGAIKSIFNMANMPEVKRQPQIAKCLQAHRGRTLYVTHQARVQHCGNNIVHFFHTQQQLRADQDLAQHFHQNTWHRPSVYRRTSSDVFHGCLTKTSGISRINASPRQGSLASGMLQANSLDCTGRQAGFLPRMPGSSVEGWLGFALLGERLFVCWNP